MSIYRILEVFPAKEKYSLVSQIRRCAVSVPANIVEGSVFNSNKSFRKYLEISLGSLSELEYYLYLATELKYLESNKSISIENEIIELKKMLNKLITKVSIDIK